MASCYWAQPAQLHPWYKPATLKRKLPAMLPRSESSFPVDEYNYDSRVKRQRCIALDQTRSKKRNLPSPSQSPTNESGDLQLPKRQRCTALESGIERLSLTPRVTAPQLPESVARQPAPVSAVLAHVSEISSQWPKISLPTPSPYPIPSPSPPSCASIPFSTTASMPSTAALIPDPHAVPDVKMRTQSWYELEKDRIIVTDLDVSSDDEPDVVDDAPKLPRAVLKALLRGPERDTPPLAGLLLLRPHLSQSLDSPPLLESARLSEVDLDEAMDVEQ